MASHYIRVAWRNLRRRKALLFINILGLSIGLACFSLFLLYTDYAYRIDLKWWVFAATGGAAFLIAGMTVAVQAVKAAMANPVKSLRAE